MTPEQIKHMVDRFLGWKLPDNFAPDGGISFDPVCNAGFTFASRREPTGTNLLDAVQAKAMVLYLMDGLPGADSIEVRLQRVEDWIQNYRPVYTPPPRY